MHSGDPDSVMVHHLDVFVPDVWVAELMVEFAEVMEHFQTFMEHL